jgi:hypothetical protein
MPLLPPSSADLQQRISSHRTLAACKKVAVGYGEICGINKSRRETKKSRFFLLRPAAAAQKGSQNSRGGLQKSESAGFTCATAGM